MHIVILIAIFIGVIIGPGIWVKAVMARYHHPPKRYDRSGAQMARALLDDLGLSSVLVESTEQGDHYDPRARAVRLSAQNHDSYSLTSITIAAHEVGHAIQDARGFKPLKWRTHLVTWVQPIEKIGAGLLMLAPFSVAFTRAPTVGLITFAGGVLTLGSAVVVHALTLPTEFDASFSRALPILQDKQILRQDDIPKARQLLFAAALTYVSGALQSLLNIARWWAILRR